MRNLLNRMMCLLCTMVIFLGCLSGLSLGANAAAYQDVPASSWYQPAVSFAKDAGYMNGISAHHFDPNGVITRGMLATVLYRMSGATNTYATPSFKDNHKEQWYFNAIEYCAEMGIVNGYGNGYFGAKDALSRQDMMTMFYRYAVKTGVAGSSFKTPLSIYADASKVSAYAVTSVNWCLDMGVISGTDYTTLSPKATCTRAQLAQVLMNFSECVLGRNVSSYRKTSANPYGVAISKVQLYKQEFSFRLYGIFALGNAKMKVTYHLADKETASQEIIIVGGKNTCDYTGSAATLYKTKDPNYTGTHTPISATVQLYDNGQCVYTKVVSFGTIFQYSPNNTPLYFKGSEKIDCRILLYHEFIHGQPNPANYGEISTPQRFEEHMKYLLNNGYTVVPLTALLEYNKGTRALPKKCVALTFDDGYLSNYSMIFPILKKYNLPATIFVVINSMNQPGRLTWAQMREMEQSGLVDIQSHSMRHVDHSTLSNSLLHEYIGNSFKVLDQQLGKQKYRVFAYPYGRYGSEALQIGQQYGAVMQMSTRWGAVDMEHMDFTQLPRINVAYNSEMADLLKVKVRR